VTGYPYDAPPPVRDTCDHCDHMFQREADDHRPTCPECGWGWCPVCHRFAELKRDAVLVLAVCGACVHRCSTCGIPYDGDPNHWRGDRHMVADPGAGFAGCAVADLVECGVAHGRRFRKS